MTSNQNELEHIVGHWKGVMDHAETKLEVIINVQSEENLLSSTMDIPDQGLTGIPIKETTFSERIFKINIPEMQITFEGTLSENIIQGTLNQAGQVIPLSFNRFDAVLPGDPSLPSSKEELAQLAKYDSGNYKYQVEDYFARPKASAFQISPNGKYLSYKEKDDHQKRHIYVKNIDTGEITRAIEEKEELIRGYGWVNDERLFFAMDKGGDENYHIYASDIDGGNTRDLTPFEAITASVINILKDQKDFVIISMNKNNQQIFEPYKLNVVTGELTQLFENKDVNNPIDGYLFDKDGELRGYSKMVDGITQEFYYKNLETGTFNLLKRNNWDDTFGILAFDYTSEDKNIAYVKTNLDSDKAKIVLFNAATNTEIREVFSHSEYDTGGMKLSRKRNYEIDYFYYEGEKYEVIPVSETYKALQKRFNQEFEGYESHLIDKDEEETRYLIFVQSDRLYGKYYEYDVSQDAFSLLYDLMPQLHEEDMSEMKPIKFESRDGLTIHGYITLPKEALEGQKVPLVVNPHGGPQGIRDSWGFNHESQLFASRGYATLQVNFRISGGYGKAFLRAGFKQIGRKLMNDIEDGVQYVIDQGWIDSSKIAIYGGSHGGYATLMGLVKTPELYVCGVDYVGVSNIETFFDSFPEYWKPYKKIVEEIWYDLNNPEEAKIAREVSPVFQIDKINKPLFVIQGANDPRVKIAESDQIVKALRDKGYEVPYLVKYNEGHGFAREENSLELYRYMMGFLAKCFEQKHKK